MSGELARRYGITKSEDRLAPDPHKVVSRPANAIDDASSSRPAKVDASSSRNVYASSMTKPKSGEACHLCGHVAGHPGETKEARVEEGAVDPRKEYQREYQRQRRQAKKAIPETPSSS